MICSRSCTHQFHLSSLSHLPPTFNFNCTPIHNPPAFWMLPKTRKTTAASSNTPHPSHSSPPKTWKRMNLAAGNETLQKKSKLLMSVDRFQHWKIHFLQAWLKSSIWLHKSITASYLESKSLMFDSNTFSILHPIARSRPLSINNLHPIRLEVGVLCTWGIGLWHERIRTSRTKIV